MMQKLAYKLKGAAPQKAYMGASGVDASGACDMAQVPVCVLPGSCGAAIAAEPEAADLLVYLLAERGYYLLGDTQRQMLICRLPASSVSSHRLSVSGGAGRHADFGLGLAADGQDMSGGLVCVLELDRTGTGSAGQRPDWRVQAYVRRLRQLSFSRLLACAGAVSLILVLRAADASAALQAAAQLGAATLDRRSNMEKRGICMDINEQNIEEIVKQVLAGMTGAAPQARASSAAGASASTSRVAMLTAPEHYEIKSYPIPVIGDDDILVKVEGCGICGTDAHEFKRDPFGLIPVVLGHEGTGEIVRMGKNVKKDSAGKPLAIGDKVVTCMIFHDNPDITMFDLNKQNVGGADVYGLLPDDDIHLNGWFADYIVIRGGSTVFNVSDLSLDLRILIEPCAVLVHAVERAKTTGILRFNSRVAVQGCGPIGLICIAVLRTMGIEHITAIDGEAKRLDFARQMGASATVNFKEHSGIEALTRAVTDSFGGYSADFAFQCTGSPVAHSNIYKFIRNGGGLCELGFFINGGDATINPHFDICSKEITTVGSWVYTLRDYATTFDFLKRAKGIGLPLEKLITHRFPLEKINEAHQTNLKMEGLKIAIIND